MEVKYKNKQLKEINILTPRMGNGGWEENGSDFLINSMELLTLDTKY